MKIFFIVIDGLGDRPIKELGNKTPLEAAETPHLDCLAEHGACGQLTVKFSGAIPTSEEGHFSLFGYDPKLYKIKRGFFTAQGAGLKVKEGDIALRGNFATVDKGLNIIDRRAGRIKETKALLRSLNGMLVDNVRFLLKGAGEHRIGIVMKGKGLSPHISDGDPFYGNLGKKAGKIKPLDKTKKTVFTAQVLNEFLEKANQILSLHPYNKKRERQGLLCANYILTRGASGFSKIPGFEKKYGLRACCIAGKILYQQIAEALGMNLIKVKGANGLINTNLKGKILAAQRSLDHYRFVFLHIKAADSLAEDGNFKGKKEFIEKIDRRLKPLLKLENVLIVVTADHSTCSKLKRHCSEPVPVLVFGREKDKVEKFSERACKKGKLGKILQLKLMEKVLLCPHTK